MSNIINTVIKGTESVVNKIDDKFSIGVYYVIDLIQSQIAGLIKFLIDRNIIQIGIGLLIATQIKQITTVLQDALISPIVNRFTMGHTKKLEDIKYEMFGTEIKIGIILSTLINFIVVILIIYFIWQLVKIEDHTFIVDFFNSLKPNIKQ